MLTIGEFLDKYLGRKIDFDSAYGAQCVDLFRQYCREVLGVSQPKPVDGARELWINDQKDFNKLSKNMAEPGDTIIWNSNSNNSYGHVAIVLSLLPEDKVLVAEQDGFKQEGTVLKIRSLNGALGVLRPKNFKLSNNKESLNKFLANLNIPNQQRLQQEGIKSFIDLNSKVIAKYFDTESDIPYQNEPSSVQQAQIQLAGTVLKAVVGIVAYKHIKNKGVVGV